MFCRVMLFFAIVLVMTYPIPLRVQQQRFAAQIANQIDLESKKVIAQQHPVSTKGTMQLYNFVTLEKAWRRVPASNLLPVVGSERSPRSEQNVEKYVSICDGKSQQAQRSKYFKKE